MKNKIRKINYFIYEKEDIIRFWRSLRFGQDWSGFDFINCEFETCITNNILHKQVLFSSVLVWFIKQLLLQIEIPIVYI